MEDPFLQCRDKYKDAIGLEQKNADLFSLAGKCDLLIGDLNSANRKFSIASSIRPSSIEFKFFMGLTIVLRKEKSRYEVALDFLLRGFNEIQLNRVGLASDSIKTLVEGGNDILQCQKKWITHDINVVRGENLLQRIQKRNMSLRSLLGAGGEWVGQLKILKNLKCIFMPRSQKVLSNSKFELFCCPLAHWHFLALFSWLYVSWLCFWVETLFIFNLYWK